MTPPEFPPPGAIVNPAALRRQTEEAIARGKETARKIAEEKRLDAERKDAEEKAKAYAIIAQIPRRCETESAAGRAWADVMGIRYHDYQQPPDHKKWNECKPEWLVGVARLVWDWCVQAKLKPTLEFWYSGDGMESGFNIVIHW